MHEKLIANKTEGSCAVLDYTYNLILSSVKKKSVCTIIVLEFDAVNSVTRSC